MGELIVFYVPVKFKSSSAKWIPPSERGKVIQFQALQAKSA
jgi:hypothetical protein